MITLIIETSTDKSLIAFAQGGNLLLKSFLPHGTQSSSYLMSEIEKGLQDLKLFPSNLEAVAVGIGPGSYTGIRVGAAAAKGLSFLKSLPLIGFCSLEGFISEEDGKFVSLIDARIGGYYLLLQEKNGNGIQALSQPQLVSQENLTAWLQEYPVQAGPHISYPDPSHLARLVAQKLKNGEFGVDLELLYLRTPEYQTA